MGEISSGRWEGPSSRRGAEGNCPAHSDQPSRRSRRGVEGNCPAHWGPGSLLSSQADPLPSKPPPGCMGPCGHRREAGEIRRGRPKGPSQTPDQRSRRGEEGMCPVHLSPESLLGFWVKDKMVEITAEEQNKEKRMKRIEGNLRDLWDNTKRTNIQIIGVSEEEEKKTGSEKIFEEIIVENFLTWERK